MNIYINGTGCISPQDTAQGGPLLDNLQEYDQVRLAAIDPDYKQWIDVKQIRRMSHVVKMGVGAANLSLQAAGINAVDAIITGTAYGCLDDTGVFLAKMVKQQEEMLTPTAFIQSTHNTVAGQIALLMGCQGYNNTFVHRGFSFEQALLDATMILKEGSARQILAGGLDELTQYSYDILHRFGIYKKEPVKTMELLNSPVRGTIAGEGAAFFTLGTEKIPGAVATLTGLSTLYKPLWEGEVIGHIMKFLEDHQCTPADIDLLITGRNGDIDQDEIYEEVAGALFPDQAEACFKHLCGEYPTAMAFGMWMANSILSEQQVPEAAAFFGRAPEKINRILLYNHHQGTHHSLILISAC
ncbi:beta-ketoacyl synthase chain length factor [Chitinophaga nivalis]|uniref:Beta-ketoacyl synthase chain length factor n=1 Tax=Chitinophaga nivalis TaxID=2991709 RepID=A0ABT3IFP6_9BACT|nr:beta-ketoacyl synthase chain length factor [Chitinophaga nivalis]MCW3467531.1 beta-ketoacyl synthase chain length factor [Chitinophaga nivalis]MCW3482777.1 beta-ketoacyl synthase chain length factor [Chitinophaga nivalis]